jgi:hypothetical protein
MVWLDPHREIIAVNERDVIPVKAVGCTEGEFCERNRRYAGTSVGVAMQSPVTS